MSAEQTRAAIATTKTNAARLAAKNPAKLAKAVRVARAGYEAGLVTVDDLTTSDIAAPIAVEVAA